MRVSQTKVLVATLCLASVACNKSAKPAEAQEQGQVEIPATDPAADALASGRTIEFKGSAVIFAADAAPEAIARIAVASKASRQAKTTWVSKKRSAVDPLAAKDLQLTKAIQQTESEARRDPGTNGAQEAVARGWIDEQWAPLGLDAGRLAAAKAVFGRYCEAKIWELAVSPLAFQNYTQRPSPLILCEPHFAAKGLLQGPTCAASAAGRSYFPCIWKEGLLKTSYFVDRYKDAFAQSPDEKKDAKIAAWVDDGTLQGVLSGDKANKLVNAALAQEKLRVGTVLGANYKDAFVPDAGTPAEDPALALADASPLMLQLAVEDGEQPATPPALLFAKKSGLSTPQAAALATLHANIRAMAQRDSLLSSASDFLFNHPVLAVAEPAQVTTVKASASFQPIFDAIAPALKQRLTQLNGERQQTRATYASELAAADELFDAYTKALLTAAIAASQDGATDALWISVKLSIERLLDGVLRVDFQLDEVNATVAEVCLDATTLGEIDCPPPLSGETRQVVGGHVEHDAATGLLALEMTLDAPEPLGFALTAPPEPGSGNPFSLIDPATLKTSRLRLELYPARDGGLLDFYSGKVLINGPDAFGKTAVLHEGATQLMAD